jgi:hypothetical protein
MWNGMGSWRPLLLSPRIWSRSSDHQHLLQRCLSICLVVLMWLACIDTRWASLYINNSQESLGEVSGLTARLSWATCSEQFTILKNPDAFIQSRMVLQSVFWISAVGKLKDWHNCAMSRLQNIRFNGICRKIVFLKRSFVVLDIELLVQPYSVDYQLMFLAPSALQKRCRS